MMGENASTSGRVPLLILLGLTALSAVAWQATDSSGGVQPARVLPSGERVGQDGRVLLPPPPADPNDFKVSSDVEVVLLDVSVKDKRGGFVSGLTKESFQIWEDKVPQELTIFGAQDAPVTVGLIVDNSASVRQKKPEIVTAALTFVTQSNPKDEVFIVNFNDHVLMGLPDGVPFTDNTALLRSALLSNPSQGRTALYDAIHRGLQHLELGRLDKKTLVVISDGGDNASVIHRDELMQAIESSLATIYTVGIFDPSAKDKNLGFLKDLAKVSGGEAFMPDNMGHLVGVCEKIAHDIRNRYTIGYSPKNLTYDGKPRKLKVVARDNDGRELEVRTRTHYIPYQQQSRVQAAR